MDMEHNTNDQDEDIDLITFGFNQKLDLGSNNNIDDHAKAHVEEEQDDHNKNHDHDDDDDDDDDFTFMLVGHDEAQVYNDEMFEDGKIRPVFPLFDQNLLLDGEYDIEEIDQLPVHPPVDKIFIESPRGYRPSTTSKQHEEHEEDVVTGPYCDWSTAKSELSKKSNSTGFSKLWRLKDIVGRSNSDGRDAFVFLKGSDRSTAATTSSSKPATSDGTYVKVNVAGGKARVVKHVTKAKIPTVSPHEAYLRNRGGHTEEERRRSYLPYRPELMGIFTNVHGGLSKNVHPY